MHTHTKWRVVATVDVVGLRVLAGKHKSNMLTEAPLFEILRIIIIQICDNPSHKCVELWANNAAAGAAAGAARTHDSINHINLHAHEPPDTHIDNIDKENPNLVYSCSTTGAQQLVPRGCVVSRRWGHEAPSYSQLTYTK
jgi:hypothetical protein